jgi:hypothetical protein
VADPRITTARAVEHVSNGTGINIAWRRKSLEDDGWDDLSCGLFCEALDLAADLIDARATIEALRAELAAARELRGVVTAAVHAREIRGVFWRQYECDTRATPFWMVSKTRADLIATLTRSGIPEADAVRAADGGE